MSSPSTARSRARVLIVDDEPGLRRAAERVLAAEYEVRSAATPSQALAEAPGFAPDLVVCDIRMPEMDGFALVARLREAVPGVDVIFMTGSHSEPDAMLIRAIQHEAFYFIEKPFDRRVLSTLVARCLELRRLRHAERAHTGRMARELDEARVFQLTMLPPSQTLAGLRIEAECRPCHELGGDLYDFALAPSGRLAILIADVRGHGATAALMTAVVKSAFWSATLAGGDPLHAVDALAAGMAPFGDDRFVTAICARLDPSTGVLEYVNAGHPPPMVWSDKQAPERLDSTGPLVSPAFGRGAWAAASTKLGPRPRLLLYTDGLLECICRSPANAMDRIATVAATTPAGGRPLIDALLTEAGHCLAGKDPPDDISIVTIGPALGP